MNKSILNMSPKKIGYTLLFLPLLLLLGFPGLTKAGGGANILIVAGTDAFAITAANVLKADLTTGSNTVTVVQTGVPESLAGYTQIFDVRYGNSPSFTVGEQNQYLTFLNASPGNAIFLMGENSGFNTRNIPMNNFIALAGGGTIAPPARTSLNSETVNSPFTGPTSISTIKYAACGLVTSSGTGAFASSEAGGGCAIFFGLGTLQNATQGALVVVYDVNFIASAPTGGAVNEVPFRQNLEQFVSAPTTPPTVTSISPASSSMAGGIPVTITGTGFTGATGVTIGGVAATSVTVVSDTSITATVPPGTAGAASVVVTTPGGVSAANTLYTYTSVPPPTVTSISPAAGSVMGGAPVTITGSGFTGTTGVSIGEAAATNVTVVSDTSITATTPPGPQGPASVVVTATGGSSSGNTSYTYAVIPTVTSIGPATGTVTGGAVVTITGHGFTGATGLTIGGAAAMNVTVVGDSTIIATTPPGAPGPASVVVTATGGSSSANTLFTYGVVPTVTSVSPVSGSIAGGIPVTIAGHGFTGATGVTIGGTAATNVTVVSDTSLTATTPPGALGPASVVVTSIFGANPANSLYTYGVVPAVTSISPFSGSIAGGTVVIISGHGFTGVTGVKIGGVAATNVVFASDTSLVATTPPGPPGKASVLVTATGGVNPGNTLFTYLVIPPPLQMYSLTQVNLQVVENESLSVSGAAALAASQSIPWQASTTTSWLTLNLSAGTFPGVVTMTANAAGLALGTYNGTITVAAGGQTLAVPVTLTVLPPQSLTADTASIRVLVGYPVGSAAGYDIQVGPAGVPFAAQTSASSSGWLSLSPASGTGPATIHVVVDPTKATYGTYQDSIVITSAGAPNSPLTIPVTMGVSSFIPMLPQQINAGTGAGADHTVAPNEIVSLFLTDFSCPSQPVVSLNGTAVAWSSYVPGQINYAVPAGVVQPAALSVSCAGGSSWSFNGLNVAANMPGIFSMGGTGAGQAAAIDSGGTANSAVGAASRGDYISIFATGLGLYGPRGAYGLRSIAGTVTASVGGVPAVVEYAGEAPGNTDGLQQVNLIIPAGSPVGSAVPIMLWVNGTPTQATATIAVK